MSSVLCEANSELNNTDRLPDTQMVRESTLPFPRESLWAVARTIGRARAVYTRFLFLIPELKILEGFSSSQYKEMLGAERLHEAMVNTIMPQLRSEFVFLLLRRAYQDTFRV